MGSVATCGGAKCFFGKYTDMRRAKFSKNAIGQEHVEVKCRKKCEVLCLIKMKICNAICLVRVDSNVL